MSAREQVADLRAGDVVEYVGEGWPDGTVLRGPVYEEGGYLYIGGSIWLRNSAGYPSPATGSLTVISRAKPPLYVNSDKTEPDPGDVVRDADSIIWLRDSWTTWHSADSTCEDEHQDTGLERPLRLLVDGRTGQVVL